MTSQNDTHRMTSQNDTHTNATEKNSMSFSNITLSRVAFRIMTKRQNDIHKNDTLTNDTQKNYRHYINNL